ncbi:MAG: global cell cycle regulator GcrA-like protein [Rhodospirillales bacterium]|nr:global cell cycle regulator GcrA-like protein [Rhodospirillales bacterium]
MAWTDAKIATLTKFWADGLSTAEIGRRIDMSKNAVVAKAHRLNLPGRPSPIPQRGADYVPVEKVQKPAPMAKAVNAPLPPVRLEAVLPCQWPIGDPRETGFHFCNARRVAGKPYCSDHSPLAYLRCEKHEVECE